MASGDIDKLFRAAGTDDVEQIRVLVSAGADPNIISPQAGHTPLYNACFGKALRAVDTLLKLGADPNKRFTYRSFVDGRVEADAVALMYAGTAEIAQALIAAGAEVNVADADGTTPLMRAAFRGSLDVVRVLLAAGADPLAQHVEKNSGKTHTARELADSKIEHWKEHAKEFDKSKVEALLQKYDEVRRMLLDAEKPSLAR